MGFEVLVLGWIGVQDFGAGVDWGSRFWSWAGLGFEVYTVKTIVNEQKHRKNTRKMPE